jgi:hypothetical protein
LTNRTGGTFVWIFMALPLTLAFESTLRCGEAKIIGQNAEKIRARESEIRNDGNEICAVSRMLRA